jgi:hypothetical protein
MMCPQQKQTIKLRWLPHVVVCVVVHRVVLIRVFHQHRQEHQAQPVHRLQLVQDTMVHHLLVV